VIAIRSFLEFTLKL